MRGAAIFLVLVVIVGVVMMQRENQQARNYQETRERIDNAPVDIPDSRAGIERVLCDLAGTSCPH